MWLRTSCDFTFAITTPVPFMLMLRPRSGAQQWGTREEYRLAPSVPVYEFTDHCGNLCQRLTAPTGAFGVYTSAVVMTADYANQAFGAPFVEIQNVSDDVLGYLLYPSRYCEPGRFHQMATEITAAQQPDHNHVLAIDSWLRNSISSCPGCSDIPVSAAKTNSRQVGVCRNLAHLGIALCRSLSIPARMVVGHLYRLEPMNLHAWFETYVGGRGNTFDATQVEQTGRYVAGGYRRDAADVAVYNQFGPAVCPTAQTVHVERIRG